MQRVVLVVGALLMSAELLFPPWVSNFSRDIEGAGRSFALVRKRRDPKEEPVGVARLPEAYVNVHQLSVELIGISVVTCALYFAASPRRGEK